MLLLTKPNADDAARFLREQSRLDFNYPDVGATGRELPTKYDHDRVATEIGHRSTDFQKAKAAMLAWKHFDVGWAEVLPASTPIREGENIAIRARIFGLWALAACRIIEVFDDDTGTSRKIRIFLRHTAPTSRAR